MQWIQVILAIVKLLSKALPAPENLQDKEAVLSWLTTLNDPAATVVVEIAELVASGKLGRSLDGIPAGSLDGLIKKLEQLANQE